MTHRCKKHVDIIHPRHNSIIFSLFIPIKEYRKEAINHTMKKTPTAQPKVDITPETLYNFTKLMEQCAPLAALLENHKSDPSGVLESEMKGVSDMAKRHKQRVKIGVNENGDSVYKWADGYTIDELNDNIVRIYIENGLLDRVKSDQPPRQKINTKGECPTFREYVPKWFATFKEYQLKPNTIKGYRSNFRRHIYPFFGDMKLDEITTDDIQRFLNEKEYLARNTVHTMLILVGEVLESAYEDKLMVKYATQNISNQLFVSKDEVVYSPDDKYKAMVEKNPQLAELRKLFPNIDY